MPRVLGLLLREHFRMYGGGVKCLAKKSENFEIELEYGV